MSPEVALYTKIASDAAVVALVQARIYPAGRVPQTPTFPLVTYQLLPGTPVGLTHDRKTDTRKPRIQIDVYGLSVLSIGNVESAIERAVHGKSWLTSDNDRATAMQARGAGDLPVDDVADPAPGQKLHRRSVDYFVHFRKAA